MYTELFVNVLKVNSTHDDIYFWICIPKWSMSYVTIAQWWKPENWISCFCCVSLILIVHCTSGILNPVCVTAHVEITLSPVSFSLKQLVALFIFWPFRWYLMRVGWFRIGVFSVVYCSWFGLGCLLGKTTEVIIFIIGISHQKNVMSINPVNKCISYKISPL